MHAEYIVIYDHILLFTWLIDIEVSRTYMYRYSWLTISVIGVMQFN